MNKYFYGACESYKSFLSLFLIATIVGCSSLKNNEPPPVFLRQLDAVMLPEINLTDATLIDAVRVIREEWKKLTDSELPLSEAYSNMETIDKYKVNECLPNLSALAALNHLTNIYPVDIRFLDNCLLLENKKYYCEMTTFLSIDEYMTTKMAKESFPFAQQMELFLKDSGCDFEGMKITVDNRISYLIIGGSLEEVEYALGVIELCKKGYIVDNIKNTGHDDMNEELISHLIKPQSKPIEPFIPHGSINKSTFPECLDKIIIPEANFKKTDVLDAMTLIVNELEKKTDCEMPFYYQVGILYEKLPRERVITTCFKNISGLNAISYIAGYCKCEIYFPVEGLSLTHLSGGYGGKYNILTVQLDESMLKRISTDGILSLDSLVSFLKEIGLTDKNLYDDVITYEIIPGYDMIYIWGKTEDIKLVKAIFEITKRGYRIKRKTASWYRVW